MLRVAPDWMGFYVDWPLTTHRWDELLSLAAEKGQSTLCPGINFDLRWEQHRGTVVAQHEYLRVAITHPNCLAEGRSGRHVVEVTFYGAFFERIRSGGVREARELLDLVCAWLFPEVGRNAAERWAVIGPHSLPGRIDFAVDTVVTGPDAESWISEEIFANGNVDAASERYRTHTKKKMYGQQVGSPLHGRSHYLGAGTAQQCIYEKTKQIGDGHATLRETYMALGWDGVSPIIRREMRIKTREWWRDQMFDLKGDGNAIEGHRLTFEDALQLMPTLAKMMSERWRQVQDAPGEKKRRPLTDWQVDCETAMMQMTDSEGNQDIVYAVSVKRAERAAAKVRTAARAQALLMEQFGITEEQFQETVAEYRRRNADEMRQCRERGARLRVDGPNAPMGLELLRSLLRSERSTERGVPPDRGPPARAVEGVAA